MTFTLEELNGMMGRSDASLDLSGCTGLTSLPDGLTVGDSLYLSGCTGLTNKDKERKNVKRLSEGAYIPGRYLYVDGILTHVSRKKKCGEYTLFVGKIPGRNVVFDGENYAHCKTLRAGIADLLFKKAEDRGAGQYKGMSLDKELTVEEAVTMYRVITGACRQGSEAFVNSLGKLKERYTVRECIEQTKGQYGSERFAEFFEV